MGWNYHREFKWCWACSIPTSVLKEAGSSHDFLDCPWNDTLLGVAWMIWHDRKLFEEMVKQVPCNLKPICERAEAGEKREWFKWLANVNKQETSYNVHELWMWYFKTRIEPSLQR